MVQNNSFNFAGLNKYTVSSSASNGSYTTIQSAINAASTAGGGTIFVLPGTYTQNLTIPGSISLVGAEALGQSSVVISGNATITNVTGSISIENVTMTAASGTTLSVSTNTVSTASITISNSIINNTSSSGTALSTTSTSTGNPSTTFINGTIQSSGIGIASVGTQTLITSYSSIIAASGSALDLTGAITASSVYNNMQSSASNAFILRSSTVALNCFTLEGYSALEVFSFAAAGSITVGNSSFYCSAPSGNWATGAGSLSYSSISIIGTAQSIATATTKIPIYSQPRQLSLAGQVITSNQTMVSNNAYYVTSGSLSLALPASSSIGDIIQVSLSGGVSWTITQAAGQSIILGNQSTTAGVGHSVASNAAGDSITISCITANTTWQMTSVVGNPTVA